MSTPELVHAAVLTADPDELVRLTMPEIRPALEAGEQVEAVLGRRGVRAFREALPDADGFDVDQRWQVVALSGEYLVDEEVVVDANLVTSRNPDDIPAFSRTLLEKLGG